MYDEALERLTTSLFDSGRAQEILDERVAVVEGSGLVDGGAVTAEADSIRSYFD